jgi:hypothetical protein
VKNRLALIGLMVAVLCGAALRLVWVDDMEYKGDEQWTFKQTQEALAGEPPRFGMSTSLGFVNPPLSLWVFAAPAVVFKIRDPLVLVRVVHVGSVAAILLLLWFAWWMVPPGEVEPWLWGTALASVNPFVVMFGRKIWAQSMLPLFLVLMLIGWWRRERWYGAFLWGLCGALIGQIHLAAFLSFGGFLLWAGLFDRRGARWWWCGAGIVVGMLPMLPWINYVFIEQHMQIGQAIDPRRLLDFDFWRYWMTEPMGVGLQYSLGDYYPRFLGYPLIGGHRTWLVLLVQVVSGATGLAICLRGVWRRLVNGRLSDLVPGRATPTSFTLGAAFWGFGLMLSLPGVPIHRFYLIAAFPLTFVWLAWLALPEPGSDNRSLTLDRRLLLTLVCAELLLTMLFLFYIHVNGGARGEDYGVVYRLQQH